MEIRPNIPPKQLYWFETVRHKKVIRFISVKIRDTHGFQTHFLCKDEDPQGSLAEWWVNTSGVSERPQYPHIHHQCRVYWISMLPIWDVIETLVAFERLKPSELYTKRQFCLIVSRLPVKNTTSDTKFCIDVKPGLNLWRNSHGYTWIKDGFMLV